MSLFHHSCNTSTIRMSALPLHTHTGRTSIQSFTVHAENMSCGTGSSSNGRIRTWATWMLMFLALGSWRVDVRCLFIVVKLIQADAFSRQKCCRIQWFKVAVLLSSSLTKNADWHICIQAVYIFYNNLTRSSTQHAAARLAAVCSMP